MYLLQLGCVTLIKLFEVIISHNCCAAAGQTCKKLWVVLKILICQTAMKAGPPSSWPTPAVVFTW